MAQTKVPMAMKSRETVGLRKDTTWETGDKLAALQILILTRNPRVSAGSRPPVVVTWYFLTKSTGANTIDSAEDGRFIIMVAIVVYPIFGYTATAGIGQCDGG